MAEAFLLELSEAQHFKEEGARVRKVSQRLPSARALSAPGRQQAPYLLRSDLPSSLFLHHSFLSLETTETKASGSETHSVARGGSCLPAPSGQTSFLKKTSNSDPY